MFKRYFFIVTPSFHGATLLSKLLNDHSEIMSLGDTYPSSQFDQVCGCGEYVSRCPFWQQVGRDVGVERYRDHPHWLPDYPAILGGGKDRLLYNMLSPHSLGKVIQKDRQKSFVDDFTAFTRAVHAYGGRPDARIFVDGVKSISRVFALAACGVAIDGVIHLQRNPRDYIQSTMKQNGYSHLAFVRRLVNYRLFHNRARRIGREFPYLSVTYEGLAEAPETALYRLFRFLGVEPLPLSELVAEGQKRPWHFMGNASLFHFDGTIRRSWHDISPKEKRWVRLIAGKYESSNLHLRTNHQDG